MASVCAARLRHGDVITSEFIECYNMPYVVMYCTVFYFMFISDKIVSVMKNVISSKLQEILWMSSCVL